jgi:hypothetical protein
VEEFGGIGAGMAKRGGDQMSDDMVEFASSEHGDRWLVGRHQVTGLAYVMHIPNESSGGHIEEIELADFLSQDRDHPERLRLLRLIGAWAQSAVADPAT